MSSMNGLSPSVCADPSWRAIDRPIPWPAPLPLPLAKAGFRREGYARARLPGARGHRQDDVLFALLAGDVLRTQLAGC